MSLPPAVDAVIAETCRRLSVPRDRLLGHGDRIRLGPARAACWGMIRELPGPKGAPYSYPQIGRWFDGRHHTTILTGVQRYQRRHRPRSAARPELRP